VNHPSLPSLYSAPAPAALPVSIDYPAALALRHMALANGSLPEYVLAPEVSALLHYVPDMYRRTLLDTLWNTGARINEALPLSRGDFSLIGGSLEVGNFCTLSELFNK